MKAPLVTGRIGILAYRRCHQHHGLNQGILLLRHIERRLCAATRMAEQRHALRPRVRLARMIRRALDAPGIRPREGADHLDRVQVPRELVLERRRIVTEIEADDVREAKAHRLVGDAEEPIRGGRGQEARDLRHRDARRLDDRGERRLHRRAGRIDDAPLDPSEPVGIDPYNSGQFDRSRHWNSRFRD